MQKNAAGCIVQAQFALGFCDQNGDQNYPDDPASVLDSCQTTYSTAVVACNAGSKPRRARDINAVNGTTAPMDGLFQYADHDGSGSVSIEEFLALVNATTYGSLTRLEDVAQYLSHFLSFDKDGDLAISSHEVKRS